MNAMVDFGRMVRDRRKQLALTQAELAGRVGCSEITIRKIEAGERSPSRQIAELLARALEIAAADYAAFVDGGLGIVHKSTAAPSSAFAPLPTPITRLLGREADLAAIRRYLIDGHARLLTLVGPPGIGKTRLSMEAAVILRDHFADGIVFVPLSAISEPALALPLIAQTFGVAETGDTSLFSNLVERIKMRRALLVLDNFEHVLPAAPDVARLLEACPGIVALATSRIALFLRGEHVYPLEALALPALTFPLQLETVARAPAVELFVERAMAVAPQFRLTEANVAAVVAICARLDGLPLAIELTAAHTRLLSPLALLSRLGQKLLLHSSGPRDLPPRHQTLHHAIVWSYNLLTDHEQRLFACLGLFTGDFSLEAVEEVWQAIWIAREQPATSAPLLEIIGALADHHLVRLSEDSDGAIRLVMLETIREFARERLGESALAEAAQRAYLGYYLRLAECGDAALNGPAQERWLERMEREHDQFRAILTRATQAYEAAHDTDEAVQLGAALWRFWYIRCHLTEGRRWLMALLALEPVPRLFAARARLLLGAGVLARAQGDPGEGLQLIEQSLDLARRQVLPAEIAQALYHRGVMVADQGATGAAVIDLEECLALQRERGDLAEVANVLNGLGSVLIGIDDARAVMLLDESVQLQRGLGNRRGEAFTLHSLGLARLRQRNASAAGDFRGALVLFRSLGDSIGIADCLSGLAAVAGAAEEWPRASELWYAAEQLRARIAAPLSESDLAHYRPLLAGVATHAAAPPDLEELVKREIRSA